MDYELVILTFIIAITWLYSIRFWLHNNIRAVKMWEGRYLNAMSQLRAQSRAQSKATDLSGLINALPEDIRGFIQPIIEQIPEEYRGIAVWLSKNPQLIKMFLDRFGKAKGVTEAL